MYHVMYCMPLHVFVAIATLVQVHALITICRKQVDIEVINRNGPL